MTEDRIDRLIVDVLKWGREGVSQTEMKAFSGITTKKWNHLKNTNPAFAEACEMSTGLAMAWYMKRLRQRADDGSDQLIKFALERLHGLNEKVEQEVTQKGTVEVSFASLKRKADNAD